MADLSIKASGTENLRANPSVKDGFQNEFPSGAGTPVGGTDNLRADHKVFEGSDKDMTPAGGVDHRPAGVQHYAEGSV